MLGWLPPRSPYSLIQEDIWSSEKRSEWLILVSCMMLNCTSRKQVDKVMPRFLEKWPTVDAFLKSDENEVIDLCKPLGFANRRTKNLLAMSHAYSSTNWTHASELPGIGEYASRAWEIFCRGELGNCPPKDHALTKYWHWRVAHEKRKTKKIKVDDFNKLDPAIIDGKLVSNDRLALRRGRNYELITIVQVKKITDDGNVTLWDETLEQSFTFNINTDASIYDCLKIYKR